MISISKKRFHLYLMYIVCLSSFITNLHSQVKSNYSVILNGTSDSKTPKIIGLQVRSLSLGAADPTFQYIDYLSPNSIRLWHTVNLFDQPGSGTWGDGSTDWNSFQRNRNTLLANPLKTGKNGSPHIDWENFFDSYRNKWTSSARFFISHEALSEIKNRGYKVYFIQTTTSSYQEHGNPLNTWEFKWEYWQHWYATAFYMAREFDIDKFSYDNEPDANDAGQRNATLQRLVFASDAIRCAISNVNRIYGKNLSAKIAGPIGTGLYWNTPTSTPFGITLFSNYNNQWIDGKKYPSITNVQIYAFNQYQRTTSTLRSYFTTFLNGIDTLFPAFANTELLLTEFNSYYATRAQERDSDCDIPDVASGFANGMTAFALAVDPRIAGFYAFSIAREPAVSTNLVTKKARYNNLNGLTWSDPVFPYPLGGVTKGGEAFRLFAKHFKEGREVFSVKTVLEGKEQSEGQWGRETVACRDPEEGCYYIYVANYIRYKDDHVNVYESSAPKDGRFQIDLSALNVEVGSPVLVSRVDQFHNGNVGEILFLSPGKVLRDIQLLRNTVLLLKIPEVGRAQKIISISCESDSEIGPMSQNKGNAELARVSLDQNDPSKRFAYILRFDLANEFSKAQSCVLQLTAFNSNDSDINNNQEIFHIYGVDSAGWNETDVTWNTLPFLGTGMGVVKNIRDNTSYGGLGIRGVFLGSVSVSSKEPEKVHADVTDWVRKKEGRVSFLVARVQRKNYLNTDIERDFDGKVSYFYTKESQNSVYRPTMLLTSSTHYTKYPHDFPGTLDAVMFDDGGEGKGYHDKSPGNLGGYARLDENVDCYSSPVNPKGVIGELEDGESLNYTVRYQNSGFYIGSISYSSTISGKIRILLDGEMVTASINLPPTGSVTSFSNYIFELPGKIITTIDNKKYRNLSIVFEKSIDGYFSTLKMGMNPNAIEIDSFILKNSKDFIAITEKASNVSFAISNNIFAGLPILIKSVFKQSSSGNHYVNELVTLRSQLGYGKIATIEGKYCTTEQFKINEKGEIFFIYMPEIEKTSHKIYFDFLGKTEETVVLNVPAMDQPSFKRIINLSNSFNGGIRASDTKDIQLFLYRSDTGCPMKEESIEITVSGVGGEVIIDSNGVCRNSLKLLTGKKGEVGFTIRAGSVPAIVGHYFASTEKFNNTVFPFYYPVEPLLPQKGEYQYLYEPWFRVSQICASNATTGKQTELINVRNMFDKSESTFSTLPDGFLSTSIEGYFTDNIFYNFPLSPYFYNKIAGIAILQSDHNNFINQYDWFCESKEGKKLGEGNKTGKWQNYYFANCGFITNLVLQSYQQSGLGGGRLFEVKLIEQINIQKLSPCYQAKRRFDVSTGDAAFITGEGILIQWEIPTHLPDLKETMIYRVPITEHVTPQRMDNFKIATVNDPSVFSFVDVPQMEGEYKYFLRTQYGNEFTEPSTTPAEYLYRRNLNVPKFSATISCQSVEETISGELSLRFELLEHEQISFRNFGNLNSLMVGEIKTEKINEKMRPIYEITFQLSDMQISGNESILNAVVLHWSLERGEWNQIFSIADEVEKRVISTVDREGVFLLAYDKSNLTSQRSGLKLWNRINYSGSEKLFLSLNLIKDDPVKEISIYSPYGKLIKCFHSEKLLNTTSPIGENEIGVLNLYWDGKDDYEKQVTMGTYLLVIKSLTGSFSTPFIILY